MIRASLMLCFCLMGCAGARTTIVATDSRFPVSLSEGMRAPDGHLLEPSEMEVVGQYESKHTIWGLLYSIIPLTPTTDISQNIDSQIASAGGEAIVRLKTEASHCALNHFIVFSFIPFWPGCSNLTISGDIIRYKPLVREAQPAPAVVPVVDPPAQPVVTPVRRKKGRAVRPSRAARKGGSR